MAGYLNVPTDAERNYKQRSVDSKGRAGPTLQRIADLHKTHQNNTGMLQSLFEAVAPLGMYSGDAEGAYIPSSRMKSAQGLAKVFQDWYKGGTPTINVPFERWGDIIKSGKFKNQMELAGKDMPEAWNQRVEVEKALGGYPYPKSSIKENSESLAKKNPVYGHIYNPKYTHKGTATSFGDTYAEMSDLIKEQSKYVLGDSFDPFIKTAFSSDDMLGNTSKLERALFGHNSKDWVLHQIADKPQNTVDFLEMWVPNHLARLNNIRSVHVPNRAMGDSLNRAVPVKEVPNLYKQREKNFKAIEDDIPEHLKGSIGAEDIINTWDDDILY
jgi:hypothetical protein